VDLWTDLMTYQFIIFKIIFFWIFFIQILHSFFQYIIGKLNEIFLGFDLIFMTMLEIYFVYDS